MIEFFVDHWELLLTQTASFIGLVFVIARWLGRLERDIDQRMTKEECYTVHRECAEQINGKFGGLHEKYNALNERYTGTEGRLTEAVETLKEGVNELRKANGKR